MLPEKNIEQLHQQIATVITTGKQTAYKAVNSSMILTYWEIGHLIVEEEQDGKEKAQYGKYLLRELSKRLKKDFGSGYSQPNLRNFRQFYLLYPIRYALRSELTHQDVGQMDMYVRMYEDKFKIEGDNPTIGIVLCSEKNEAVVKYSVLSDSQQIFASKYVLYLPTEKELVEELERERILAELRIKKDKQR